MRALMPSRASSSRRRTASRRWSPQTSQRRISTFTGAWSRSRTLRRRQHRDEGIEVLGIRRELPDGMRVDRGDDRVVERRRHALVAALGRDVAVQEVHLGAPPLHDVLQQRWAAAGAARGLRGEIRLELGEAAARGVSRPSSSPIRKPTGVVSVRIAWPASYIPALITITQPSVRSRPTTVATRSSLIPFWKSTTTPSGFSRYCAASWAAHSVS